MTMQEKELELAACEAKQHELFKKRVATIKERDAARALVAELNAKIDKLERRLKRNLYALHGQFRRAKEIKSAVVVDSSIDDDFELLANEMTA